MDVDDMKVGLKKRAKLGEVKLDSDDDEPIGSLLKLKKRNFKKVKLGVDLESDKKVNIEGKNDRIVEEGLGGMEDTLASFRKKLKGPKRESGSGSLVKTVSKMNELSDGCLDGSLKDEGLVAKSTLKVDEGSVDVKSSETSVKKRDRTVKKSKSANLSLSSQFGIKSISSKVRSNSQKSDDHAHSSKQMGLFHKTDGGNEIRDDSKSGDHPETVSDHSISVSLVRVSNNNLVTRSEKIIEVKSSEVSTEVVMNEEQSLIGTPGKVGNKDTYNLPNKPVSNNSIDSQDNELHNSSEQFVVVNAHDSVDRHKKLGKVEAGGCIKYGIDQNQGDDVPLATDLNEGTSGLSPPSIPPKDNGVFLENAGCFPESNNQSNERAVRRVKKRKDGDMAYEGDVDWEVLMHDRRILDSYHSVDRNLLSQSKDGLLSLDTDPDFENGGAAAVSVGLKACSVSPVEKIKFKDLLKRKNGLQQYLECRNKILSLWSKDVTRVLLPTDCGITATPCDNESFRYSLMRDVYSFLDQSGYINIGIAANIDKAEPSSRGSYKLLGEKKFEGKSGASVADSADGVSFILGQVKSTDTLPKKNDDISASANHVKVATGIRVDGVVDPFTSKQLDAGATPSIEVAGSSVEGVVEPSSTVGECIDESEKQLLELKPTAEDAKPNALPKKNDDVSAGADYSKEASGSSVEGVVNLSANEQLDAGANHSKDAAGSSVEGLVDPSPMVDLGVDEPGKQLFDVKPTFTIVKTDCSEDLLGRSLDNGASFDQQMMGGHLKADASIECDSGNRKKIIVVGAGPAGLTAARHLQRQGFSVTVLEARSRIGGRVHTDHTSLSVPVDLGASIITGVEADVASERRPDPSSLICAQLGLELTILNSDCPLYDIVTGEKVPSDVDEALEAEFNGLLDDMMLVVVQKGESATRMSLEDGLEYGLKIRRKVLSKDNGKSETLQKLTGTLNNGSDSEGRHVAEQNDVKDGMLSPLERRVMDWHFAHLEYGCAALLKEVSLPHWNQDDVYGGFGGAHCMIKGGYGAVVESIAKGLPVQLNQVVADISYGVVDLGTSDHSSSKVKVSTYDGNEFFGDAVLITVPLGCLKAKSIKFSPPLPQWKYSAIERLGFGVLNKVVLEFPNVFWDETVDYFGATAEHTNLRGRCFMFWNVKKTVGAPVLIALMVGKAALDGQDISPSDHVGHALTVLRKLFGDVAVPDPVASVVTDWGRDPYSYGAYSYVAVGASGEDYDLIGKPVDKCLFFAGEATCKEHPDTVGGAMMSGLREAVRIIDILTTGNDYTAEAEVVDASQGQSTSQKNELKDIARRLDAIGVTSGFARESLLQDMFFTAKTSSGRLCVAKELLYLPVESLKSFTGTKQGLTILNSWILDSLGKDGTQLLRHCVRILVLVSTDLVAVRLSGIGKTVKEKVCVHTSRDIRSIASQLVNLWIEVFRKEKATNGGLKLLRHMTNADSSKARGKDAGSRKPPIRVPHSAAGNKVNSSSKKAGKLVKADTHSSVSQGLKNLSETEDTPLSEEERAAIAAAEAARAALAAAEAYASSGARCSMMQLPKIPSFQKFARREQYAQMDEQERKRWSGGVLGRQDCISEIDSRNCRVRDWSVDFSATCANLENSRMSADNLSQRSHSNEMPCQMNWREHSGESAAGDSTAFTKAWVESSGSEVLKDYHAIERWQCQAAAAEYEFQSSMHIQDEEESSAMTKPVAFKHEGLWNESSVSQVTVNHELTVNQRIGTEHIKQGVVDYVASLLMPLYKARKIDKEGYKSIMKKSATKVMEQTTDAEKAMSVSEFLDFKRKNKIRAFVDKLIERHMSKSAPKV